MRRAPVVLIIAACAAVLAVPGTASEPTVAPGYRMDVPGTLALSLHGRVVAYRLRGNTVAVAVRSSNRCTTFAWRVAWPTVVRTRASCQTVASARSASAAMGARLIASSLQEPARLDVLGSSGQLVHAWPLPVHVRPGSLQVAGGLATFITRDGAGLWVARLRDGRVAFVAPIASRDHPLLGARGIAYHDDLYKRAPAGRPVLKFVPMRGLRRVLARVGRPLHTGGPIRSLSVDGARVALVVGGGSRSCDRIVFWNIAWRSAAQVSQQSGPTCSTSHSKTRISNVVLGGARAQWVATYRGRPMLVAADAIDCQEWVIRRLSDLRPRISLAGMAANGSTIVYALDNGAGSRVGRVTGRYRGQDIFSLRLPVRQVATADERIAVLGTDGTIEVRTAGGRLLRRVESPGANSLALDGGLLATTAHGRIDIYRVASGRLLRSWPLPAGSGHVDLQYRLAVVTAGRSVYVLDVMSGSRTRIAVAPVSPVAQIAAVGVVYSYSLGAHGIAKVVPIRALERALR